MTFQPASGYPLHRPRRLRGHPRLRDLVRETHLAVNDLIYPLFVYHGTNLRREIPSMPGQYQLSLDRLGEVVAEVAELGIPAIILFGIPEHKDALGSAALRDDGIVQEAIRLARKVAPDLLVITDLCFCEYTDHGHCGPLCEIGGRIDVDNDATLPLLAEQAVSHARAGADMIAPSGMMDGMVQAIRNGLDQAGFTHLPIMSYAAKFASGYYGPFRDAAESAPSFGDRRSYQMDPANGDEALREVALDLAEGADIVMVKPALAYLDIIRRVKETFGVPAGRLQRLGRVRHDQGRRRQRLDRRAADRARNPHRHQARRRRHDPDLSRPRRGEVAETGMIEAEIAATAVACVANGWTSRTPTTFSHSALGFFPQAGVSHLPKPFDAATKELLESDPAPGWSCSWAVELGAVRMMNVDLSTITAEADSVLSVEDDVPWLVHLEFQSGYDPDLPLRLQRYNVLVNYRHRQPVQSVALLLCPGADGPALTGLLEQALPDGFLYHEFRYNVVRTWERPAEEILAGGLGTLPLAPLGRVHEDDLPAVIQSIRERLDREATRSQAQTLWTATYLLMGLKYPENLDRARPRRSPEHDRIGDVPEDPQRRACRGTRRGACRRSRQGRAEGRAEEARRLLKRQASRRFGKPSPEFDALIDAIGDIERLERMTDRVLDVSSWQELIGEIMQRPGQEA